MSKSYPVAGSLKLKVSLGSSPVTSALREGQIPSSLLDLDIGPSKQAADGIKPMVRDAAFDVAEIPIVTALQAIRYGKPLKVLPVVLVARPQHGVLLRRSAAERFSPEQLAGGRIGVSSYTRTTGVWVRGILQHEYGVHPSGVTWVCTDGAHLAEYADPSNVERIDGTNATLADWLDAGRLDAAILGDGAQGSPDVCPVVSDPVEAAQMWMRTTGAIPINHVLTIDARLAQQRPDAVEELMRLMRASRARADLSSDMQRLLPLGLGETTRSLELAIRLAFEQRILDRTLTIAGVVDRSGS